MIKPKSITVYLHKVLVNSGIFFLFYPGQLNFYCNLIIVSDILCQ